MNTKWPPLGAGVRVKTLTPDLSKRSDWTEAAWRSKRAGMTGKIVQHYDAHGLCYEIYHDDGTIGYYAPEELEVL